MAAPERADRQYRKSLLEPEFGVSVQLDMLSDTHLRLRHAISRRANTPPIPPKMHVDGFVGKLLAVLNPSRRILEAGDISAGQPPDGRYLYGRVVELEALGIRVK